MPNPFTWLNNVMQWAVSTTPVNPPSGTFYEYYKSDGNKYKINSAGVEQAFGVGGDVVGPSSAVSGNLAVFDGTTGKLIKDAGVAPYEPWLVDILPTVSEPSATTGTWALGFWSNENQGMPFGQSATVSSSIAGLVNTSNAQNDAITWTTWLSAGTWNATIWTRKSTNTGIITLNIDGSSIGTIDTYNGSVVYAKTTITGFTVAASGKKAIQVKMATKNASSSGYYGQLFSISLRRTA